jgi:4-diphosphocytidyl-2-C-methyl-D-erythritol kinase
MPDLNLVLVNPGAPSPTGAVYRAYDRAVSPAGADAPPWPADLSKGEDVAAFLAGCRNDLESPAVALEPEIGIVLRELSTKPECLLARMSGSGATCFALCADRRSAETLGRRVSHDHPDWWVAPTTLAGAPH